MNILFLSTKSPYPLINGHSLRTYHILKGAAERHRVTLVTFVQQPEHELKEENIRHLRTFCHAVHLFRVPLDMSRTRLAAALFLNLFSRQPFVARKYDSSAMREKIREIIREEDIDLVHVDMLPLTAYLDEFSGLAKVLVNHNVESVRLFRWFQAESNWLKKLYLGIQWAKLRRYERAAVQKFDGCVAVSETDRSLLEERGADGCFYVVPNGTDTEFFKPCGRPKIENSVLWFGHMDVHTNRDAVLYFWREIYPVLRRRCPDVHVRFVGTAPPREIAHAADKDPRVTVTGFVEDIRPYVDEAHVVVVPIRIGSGTRLKILDAMAMGKAIVSTSVGCEGLAVTDGENILVADDPEDFSRKVVMLLRDAELRRTLEGNALQLAKECAWQKMCSLQEKVYQEVARPAPLKDSDANSETEGVVRK
jgi:glycosyltransferase involved in cell wall biosynthesis